MKKAIFITLLLSMYGCAITMPRHSPSSDLQKENLRGAVKQVETLVLDLLPVSDTSGEGTEETYHTANYNEQGNITESRNYLGPRRIETKRDVFEYDESGKKLLNSKFYNVTSGTYVQYFYLYDSKGRLARKTNTVNNRETEYVYNSRDYVRKEIVRGGPKDSVAVTRYRYDARGNIAGINGSKDLPKYGYSKAGRIETVTYADGTRELYNEQGDLVQIDHPVRMVGTDGSSESITATIKAEYEYDEHGNWICRLQSYEGRPVRKAVREIEYYGR